MMKYRILRALLFLVCISTSAQKHTPKQAALMTPWAEKIDPGTPLPEYPRPMMQRSNWQNLNGVWQFQIAQAGEMVPYGKTLKREILVPYPWESALSGIMENIATHRAWYRRTFTVPKSWSGQDVLLHFGAVDWEAVVYVNQRCVGTHQGGYDAFNFNITPYLSTKGTNEIIVEVYDPGNSAGISTGKQANNRFDSAYGYSYTSSSGIWQTVWIEPVPRVHIQDVHIIPDIDAESISVQVNISQKDAPVWAEVSVLQDGKTISSNKGRYNNYIEVPVPSPHLWSPDDPYLYDVKITLKDSLKQLDEVLCYTGMRKIEIRDTRIEGKGLTQRLMKQIYLNNKFYFNMGTLDQGYWPDGIYTAPTDDALKWDIEQTKAFGFNMIRKHIKIEPQRWYYWADKLGVLVWQDMPSMFHIRSEAEETIFERELTDMVKQHWNHPSIVLWVVFNEHWGIYDACRITENVMALDPSRLVTSNSGIDAGKPDIDYDCGHIVDNHSYRPPDYPFVSNTRANVCGEYGAIGYKIDGHIWDIDGPWVHYNYEGKDAATAEYEKFIDMLIKFQFDGLSGAVYTQWTDVENEMNGLYTYDRKVIKLDQERVKKANESTWKK